MFYPINGGERNPLHCRYEAVAATQYLYTMVSYRSGAWICIATLVVTADAAVRFSSEISEILWALWL